MNATGLPGSLPKAGGRLMLALITSLLLMPFVIASLLWQSGWQPKQQINHGELLATVDQPARQLTADHLQKNGPGAAGLLTGRWLLALAVPGECNDTCIEQLHLARQVQVTLNKDMMRLQRGLVGPQPFDAGSLATIRERWPDLAIAQTDAAGWKTLGGDAIQAPQLFLIDPQGRLVLRYGSSPDPKGVRRDVERLLKYSWIG